MLPESFEVKDGTYNLAFRLSGLLRIDKLAP